MLSPALLLNTCNPSYDKLHLQILHDLHSSKNLITKRQREYFRKLERKKTQNVLQRNQSSESDVKRVSAIVIMNSTNPSTQVPGARSSSFCSESDVYCLTQQDKHEERDSAVKAVLTVFN